MTAKKNSKQQQRRKPRVGKGSRPIPATLQVLPPAFRRCYPVFKGVANLTEAAAGAGALHTFRLNSIYDPDFTGVGNTAMGYTGLTALYALFRVVRVRVILRFALTTTGTASVGFLTGLNSTFTATPSLLEAEPNSKSVLLQGNVGGARSIHQFDSTISLPKVCGITMGQYMTDMDFGHAAGSNPAKNVYMACFLAGYSPAAQAAIADVRIIYEVEVSQPYQSITS